MSVGKERTWVLISASLLLLVPAFALWAILGWTSVALKAVAVAAALAFVALVLVAVRSRWKDIDTEGDLNEVEP